MEFRFILRLLCFKIMKFPVVYHIYVFFYPPCIIARIYYLLLLPTTCSNGYSVKYVYAIKTCINLHEI